ncbi:hypothetical protein VN12_19515 [Pirellula sp. SH-Sr6A]|uniref:hypothetical protein n=1 Tax=Pirellula sp. SH-Sr6A TaxID=1632865 RepID=UPI00078D910D|nr:hypothetical protein [Pirellula sp. SH-Sr6A]AMV34323.1 hypothetical protein VN12_19515 [Pirellula sp. SH-Sr6A]
MSAITLKEATFKRIMDAVQFVERSRMESPNQFRSSEAKTYFRNDTGQVIPAYGIIQASGTAKVSNVNYVTVERPFDYAAAQSIYLVNGPQEVKVDGYGTTQPGPYYKILSDGGTYSAGDRIGWKASSFEATNGCLFSVIGTDPIEDDIVLCCRDDSCAYGKTSASITAGSSGNVLIWKANGSGNWSAGSKTHTAYALVSNIASGEDVILFPVNGRWLATEIC